MKAWLPSDSQQNRVGLSHESTGLDPQVLALKVKIMHKPSLYEVRINILLQCQHANTL